MNKTELYNTISDLCYEIIDEIICPVTGIEPGTVWADIFMADIGCYTFGEEAEEEAILCKICQKYEIDSLDDENFVSPIDGRWELATIALYILLYGEHEHLTIKKDDLNIKEPDDEEI